MCIRHYIKRPVVMTPPVNHLHDSQLLGPTPQGIDIVRMSGPHDSHPHTHPLSLDRSQSLHKCFETLAGLYGTVEESCQSSPLAHRQGLLRSIQHTVKHHMYTVFIYRSHTTMPRSQEGIARYLRHAYQGIQMTIYIPIQEIVLTRSDTMTCQYHTHLGAPGKSAGDQSPQRVARAMGMNDDGASGGTVIYETPKSAYG